MDSSWDVRTPAPLRAALAVVALVALACSGGDAPEQIPEVGRPVTPSAPATTGDPEPSADASPGSGSEGQASGEVVVVSDEKGKATARGNVPGYVQITEAEVRGAPLQLTFLVTLARRVPPAVGGAETVRLTVGILADDGTRYSLYAQGSQDGWAAYAVGGEEGPFPGELEIDGRRVTFEMPRSYFGGVPSFRWLVNVAYSEANAYGFDALPESGYARFP